MELLKEQASALEAEIYQLRFHPRYAPLIVDGPLGLPILIDGPREAAELDELIRCLRIDVDRFGSGDALGLVREAVRAYREALRREERAAQRRRMWAY